MDYTIKGKDIILCQRDLDLDNTLNCGQAFRWEIVPSEHFRTYIGHYKRTPLKISQQDKDSGIFILHNTTEKDLLSIWYDYFDLSVDYGELKRRFSEDSVLSRACQYAGGIRLLRQDAEESLISFIISQNNNIPRIKGIIGRLCEIYGGFPSLEDMRGVTPEELSPLRAGFRAKYLADCVQKAAENEIQLDRIKEMPLDEAQKELMKIKGVGPKVAMCVLLFGMYRTDAYPVDVWIKRVNEHFYPNGLPECTQGVQGIAQQYLFHYVRTCPECELNKRN